MKIFTALFLISVFIFSASGQKSIADLQPKHAAALEQFLSSHKDYGFMSEKVLDLQYLNDMRQHFKGLKPYYNVGDFNKDKITDFAMILSRKGERKFLGENMSPEHEYDYPLAIIIFNGNKKGRFSKAFIEDIEAPTACFLNVEDKELYFGIFESDADTRIFTPVGKGYIIEYPDAP